jgi:hypothetical protein
LHDPTTFIQNKAKEITESVTIEWRSERNAGANRCPRGITPALPGELRKYGRYVLKRQGIGI